VFAGEVLVHHHLLRAPGDVGSAVGAADRSALPIAGDDETAQETVMAFLDAVGYDA